jgi:hypothetical protein
MSEVAADMFVNALMSVVSALIFATLGVPTAGAVVCGCVLSAPLWIVTLTDLLQATRRRR